MGAVAVGGAAAVALAAARSTRRPHGPERILALIARIVAFLVRPFVRFEVRGAACASWIGPAVIVANHRSLFDVVAGLVGLHHYHRYPRVLIAKEFVHGRWTGPFARAVGAIAVDRERGSSGAVEAAVAALGEGATILLLPEGRLHRDAEDPTSTGPVRSGLSRIAEAGDVPVVAASLLGSDDVWPATSTLPRLRLCRPRNRPVVWVRVDDEPTPLVPGEHQANAERVMARVRELTAVSLADRAARAGGAGG